MRRVLTSDRSQFSNYQEFFIGSTNYGEFLKYELLTMALSHLGGALGLYLRSKLYPRLFHRVGKGVFFGLNLRLRCPGKISLGSNVIIDNDVAFGVKGGEGGRD